jgi:hypothetical protein
MSTHCSIFFNKGAEDWILQKGFICRELDKTFFLSTEEFPV